MKYLRTLLVLSVVCIIPRAMLSQEAGKQIVYTIKGAAVDSAGNAVAYPTLSIRTDSTTNNYKVRYSGDGNGRFEAEYKSAADTIYITVDAAAKTSYNRAVVLNDNKLIDLGRVVLKDGEELAGVSVIAYKPLVTQTLDRINYDVEADPESKTNTVMDMLRKVPLVTLDQDENIKVKGSSSFTVYVNGKPSNMVAKNPKDILKSMPATSIKRIEVITDPGAKYDAEGIGAILNIVTQSALQGYRGSVRVSADTKSYFNTGAFISSKIGKLGLSGNYNYRLYHNDLNSSQGDFENHSDAAPYKYSENGSSRSYKSNDNYGNIEISYEFDTLNLVSASFGVSRSIYISQNDGYSQFYDKSRNTVSAYNTLSSSNNTSLSYYGNVDYQRSFRKPDQLLTVSYNFGISPPDNSVTFSKLKLDTTQPNTLATKERDVRYTKAEASNSHTLQIDYTEPFDSSKHVVEAGIKYILRYNASDNQYRRYNPITGEYDQYDLDDKGNIRKENDMDYYQHIVGAYASYTFKLKKFSLRLGGRLEGTYQDVRFADEVARNFKVRFLDLIPYVSTSFKLTDASNLRVSYNNGISRPSIWFLNPYVDNKDPYLVSYGNPNLKSERSHNFSVSYGLFSQKLNLSISVYSSIVNNSIESNDSVDSKGIRYHTYANIGSNGNLGGSFYINYNPIKWFSFWTSLSAGYERYTNRASISEGAFFSGYGGVNFHLPWKMRLHIGIGGNPVSTSYRYKGTGWYYYYTSLSRSFLKGDKISVSIGAYNFLEKYRVYRSTSWAEGVYTSNSVSRSPARSFSISVSWRFGEMKAQIKKAERGISNDDVKSGGGSGGNGDN